MVDLAAESKVVEVDQVVSVGGNGGVGVGGVVVPGGVRAASCGMAVVVCGADVGMGAACDEVACAGVLVRRVDVGAWLGVGGALCCLE